MEANTYAIIEHYDYEGSSEPEECYLDYETALEHLHEIAKKMRLKVRKGNIIFFKCGSIEIVTMKIIPKKRKSRLKTTS
jgi:hypothetical protein